MTYAPITQSQQDELDYEKYADALATQLLAEDESFCIGVFAGWGQGKSSLMKLLKAKLDQQPAPDDASNTNNKTLTLSVWFDAWKYGCEESVWRALLAQCIGDLSEQLEKVAASWETAQKSDIAADYWSGPVFPRGNSRNRENVSREQLRQYISKDLAYLKEQLYRSFSHSEKGDLSLDKAGLMKELLMIGLREILPAGGVAKYFTSLLGDWFGGDKESDNKKFSIQSTENEESTSGSNTDDLKSVEKLFGLLKREIKESYFQRIKYIEQFQEKFSLLVANTLAVLGADRLVIFIDDLDRCEPTKAIEVLEAIKLYLETPQTFFVLGVDDTVIQEGLRQRYGKQFTALEEAGTVESPPGEQRRPYHMEYLEKIIQLPFTIPSLTHQEIKAYIAKRIGKTLCESEPGLVDFFSKACEHNPRKLHRQCQLLKLNWSIVQKRGLQERISLIILAKLVVIQTNQRELYYKVLDRRSAWLRELENHYREVTYATDSSRTSDATTEVPGIEGNESSSNEMSLKKARSEQTSLSSELEAYRNLVWLRRLMTWPDDVSKFEAATFASLNPRASKKEIVEHLQLRDIGSTVDSLSDKNGLGGSQVKLDQSILRDLLNEERGIIESAVSRIPVEERKHYADKLRGELDKALTEAEVKYEGEWQRWLAAGFALGFLGDPRLDIPLWERNEQYWVDLPAGEFYRGTAEGEEGSKENNIDGTCRFIKGFQLAKFPVTNRDWSLYLKSQADLSLEPPSYWKDGTLPWGLENHPVVDVSYSEVVAYIEWLNQHSGGTYRLPTEAQWERAARGLAKIGGVENRRLYPWGSSFDKKRCNTSELGLHGTSPVGVFPQGASPEGVLDMAGNVWEWCADKYTKSYYQCGSVEANTEGSYHVVRGGAFGGRRHLASCVSRLNFIDDRSDLVGFRVARIL